MAFLGPIFSTVGQLDNNNIVQCQCRDFLIELCCNTIISLVSILFIDHYFIFKLTFNTLVLFIFFNYSITCDCSIRVDACTCFALSNRGGERHHVNKSFFMPRENLQMKWLPYCTKSSQAEDERKDNPQHTNQSIVL